MREHQRNNGLAVEELTEDSKRARRGGERMRACDESVPTTVVRILSDSIVFNSSKSQVRDKRNCSFL